MAHRNVFQSIMASKEDKRKMGKTSGFDNQYDIIRKAGKQALP